MQQSDHDSDAIVQQENQVVLTIGNKATVPQTLRHKAGDVPQNAYVVVYTHQASHTLPAGNMKVTTATTSTNRTGARRITTTRAFNITKTRSVILTSKRCSGTFMLFFKTLDRTRSQYVGRRIMNDGEAIVQHALAMTANQ